MRSVTPDTFGVARALDQTLTERVDRANIRAHSLEHDLTRDVDHVGVANVMLVHDVAHLHARPELTPLALRAKNRDLRLREIVENDFRHAHERSHRIIFHYKNGVLRADFLYFRAQG